MKWLVTGGCGFIGSNLVRMLARDGSHDIRIVDNLTVGSKANLARVASYAEHAPQDIASGPVGVELIVGDILDQELAIAASSGVDAIVHLAGNTGVQPSIDDPRSDCMANVLGTLNYLEAARSQGVKRVVFASSGGTVIGDAAPPITEDMVPHPKSPYGASKSACEGYLSAYHGTFGIETVALRFGNVYGPYSNHKSSVVACFIQRALDNQPLEIFGDGDQSRDFIYVEDLTDAITAAATAAGVGGNVFQIATSRETTVNELARALLVVLVKAGIEAPKVAHRRPLPGEIRRNYSDTSKALAQLGWRAGTDLLTGLAETVAWFRGLASQ